MNKERYLKAQKWLNDSWLLITLAGVGLALATLLMLSLFLAKKEETPTLEDNTQVLAKILMSEASIGNIAERKAVGLTVLNRMKRRGTKSVKDVLAVDGFYHYAANQNPTLYPEYAKLAKELLEGKVTDFTNGATHFFSPYSMPKQGETRKNFDCGGGLVRYINPRSEQQELICTPSWSKGLKYINLKSSGIRPYFFEFYAEQ